MNRKLVRLDSNKYKELCHYRLITYKELYYYPNYLNKWEEYSNRLTNTVRVPKDKPHYKYKLIKLKKPQWNEFLVL